MTEFLTIMGLESAVKVIPVLVFYIGISAVFTSLIVEGIKNLSIIDKIPTKLVCYLTAIPVTMIGFYALMEYAGKTMEWYLLFTAFLVSFIVAKVSINGWEDVTELFQRMIKKEDGD